MIRGILFDLDGTLLPMDVDVFIKVYFRELCKAACPLGIAPEQLIDAVQKGTGAMVHNSGAVTNEAMFWQVFEQESGRKREDFNAVFDAFYTGGFHGIRPFMGENPLAPEAVRAARGKGRKVVLATNPLFPITAQTARIGWVGLKEHDFDFITSYETDSLCKPNPGYYLSVCSRMGLKPEECLMIGNDEQEDTWAASRAGLNCYLVTDWMISRDEHPWHGPRGTFREMIDMLNALD